MRLRGGGWFGLYSRVWQGRVSKCDLLPSVRSYLPGCSSPLEALTEVGKLFKMQIAPSMMSDMKVFTTELGVQEMLETFSESDPVLLSFGIFCCG